jgi:hypothetical protein
MPLSVPAPNTGETFTEYKLRLTTLGHLGTAVEEVVLTDATLDPTKGPSAVTETIPTTGTRLLVDTNIKVRVNPTTAPTIGGSGGGMPDIPTINFDPLLQAGTCAQFPFGVPCWVYATVEHFVGSPETPEVSFHFPYGGSGINTTLSMEMFDPYMGTIRTLIGIGIMGSMLWLFYGLAFGGAIGGGRDDGSR